VIVALSDLLADLAAALTLLTRLPVAKFVRPSPNLARAVWAFPIVGLVVGGAGGLVYWLGHRLGLASALAAVWGLAASTILTGALHEDGLADTADGFGGGPSRERKLEIMRDSHIGTYGVLALVMAVLARAAAIVSLADPGVVVVAMCVAGMLGRGAILALLLVLRPVRQEGMGAAMGQVRPASAAGGMALAIVVVFLSAPAGVAIAVVLLAFGAALAVAMLAHRQIGGYTGDVLGACEIIVECVVLSVLAST
jgi:adenosylcobinamide-GDP ribazoletransferase